MKARRWTKEQLFTAAKNSYSIRTVLRKLGLKEAGGNYAQIHKYLRELKINTRHFKGQGWNKGLRGIGKPIIPLEKILIKNSTYQSYKLKKRLFDVKIKIPKC